MSRYARQILKTDPVLEKFKQEAKNSEKIFDIGNIVPQYEELYEKFVLVPSQ